MGKRRVTFGEELKRRREAAGLSVQELARKANVSRQTVYVLEADANSPTLEVLLRLSVALDTDPRDLIGPLCPPQRARK
jgi:transcriptional regulator with XRE-family HTH domain